MLRRRRPASSRNPGRRGDCIGLDQPPTLAEEAGPLRRAGQPGLGDGDPPAAAVLVITTWLIPMVRIRPGDPRPIHVIDRASGRGRGGRPGGPRPIAGPGRRRSVTDPAGALRGRLRGWLARPRLNRAIAGPTRSGRARSRGRRRRRLRARTRRSWSRLRRNALRRRRARGARLRHDPNGAASHHE